MQIRTIQLFTSPIVLAIVVATHAQAEMSQTVQQAELQRLRSVCQQDPKYRRWSQQAQGRSSRASYEDAAAMMQCFYNNVDSRYPAEKKQERLQDIRANKQRARDLK